jgi:hypothetical protein
LVRGALDSAVVGESEWRQGSSAAARLPDDGGTKRSWGWKGEEGERERERERKDGKKDKEKEKENEQMVMRCWC